MKKIISVYIIFAFLLMSFTGCGKLKDSPVSGLNQTETPASPKANSQSEAPALPKADSQTETPASPKANSQSEAPALPKADSQTDTSASSEVNSQPEAPAPPKVNSQPEAPAPPKVNSQLEAPALPKVNSQLEASSETDAKDLTKKESWNEWTERNWGRLCGVEVAFVGTALIVAGIYHYFKPAAPLRSSPPARIIQNDEGNIYIYNPLRSSPPVRIPSNGEVRSSLLMNKMSPAFNRPRSRITLRGSIKRIVIDPLIDDA